PVTDPIRLQDAQLPHGDRVAAQESLRHGEPNPGGRHDVRDPVLRLGLKPYTPRANLLPEQAVRLIRAAGGVPVAAHPYTLIRYSNETWEYVSARLVHLGIQGLEVHYPQHTPAQIAMFLKSAQEFGLLVTGGSDFHGRVHRLGGKVHFVDDLLGLSAYMLDYSSLTKLRERASMNRRDP
ncbi:MAG: hypothetical protein V2B18_24685, partial [Pseudomonadota bacterium]